VPQRLTLQGDWGNLSGTRLSNQHLSKVAIKKKLVACLERPSEACGKKSPATLLEAIVGAVYLDSEHDLGAVRKTMIALGFVEVLHNHSSKRKRQTLRRVSASEICSITLEYGVVDSGTTDQTVVYRTVPVSCT
jgi:dsRNA-specific ribonuclease